MSSSDKILSFIERFEFLAEWFITYRFPTDTNIFHQFLIALEAIKFHYRLKKFTHMGLFVQESAVEEEKHLPTISLPKDVKGTRTEMERLLEEVKGKAYQSYHHNVGVVETTSTGKQLSLRSNLPIPPQFQPNQLTALETFGELIYLLRPLVYIIALWAYGPRSYKSWLISLALDLIRIFLHRNTKVRDINEKLQLDGRNRTMLVKMLFRNPFYESIFKPKMVLPLLRKFLKEDGWITRIILYFMEMKATVSLTI